MSKPQTPRFMFGDLDRKVYLITKWRKLPNGSILALERHEVTADFKQFVARVRREGII